MPVHHEVILRWDATPEQLSAVGTALWRWCVRAAGDGGLYQYLDDQPLADLIAGTLPRSSRSDARGVHFRVRDKASPSRRATIDGLRRQMPAQGVEDILIDGVSWNQGESKGGAPVTV